MYALLKIKTQISTRIKMSVMIFFFFILTLAELNATTAAGKTTMSNSRLMLSPFMYLFILIYSHPSDLKHRFHRHQSSASLHGSFNHNHVQDTNLPLVAEEHDEQHDKGPVYDPKQDVFVSLFVRFFGHFIFDICVSFTQLPPSHFFSSWYQC